MHEPSSHVVSALAETSLECGIVTRIAAKGCWIVTAGILPTQPLPQFTRKWIYTSEHDQQDRDNNPNHDPAYHSIFAKMRAEAMDYYLQVSLPQLNNWADMKFIWY